ncbi:MAG: hypothetical protein VB066_01735 [Paludibacter sp.]|nr:hypothetical protein [Paludibacter sp.]
MPEVNKYTTIVNKFGKMQGWNSVTVNMLGRDIEGITELGYDDNIEIEGARGAGMYFVGYGEGNYEAKASITLFKEEIDLLQSALPTGASLSSIPAFNIVAEYDRDLTKTKDIIQYCKIKGRGIAVKQGDKTIAYKFDLFVGGRILWNV